MALKLRFSEFNNASKNARLARLNMQSVRVFALQSKFLEAEQAMRKAMSFEPENKLHELDGLRILADGFMRKGNKEGARKALDRAKILSEETGQRMLDVRFGFNSFFLRSGEQAKSEQRFLELKKELEGLKELAEKSNNKSLLRKILNNLGALERGYFFNVYGLYEKGQISFEKLLETAEIVLPRMEKLYSETLQLARILGTDSVIGNALLNFATPKIYWVEIEQRKGNSAKAKEFAQEAISLLRQALPKAKNNPRDLALVHYNIASVLDAVDEFEEALREEFNAEKILAEKQVPDVNVIKDVNSFTQRLRKLVSISKLAKELEQVQESESQEKARQCLELVEEIFLERPDYKTRPSFIALHIRLKGILGIQ